MRAAAHKYAILEPVAIFVAIMAYIWELRFTHPGMSLAILAMMVVSNRIHREGAGRLGFQPGPPERMLREIRSGGGFAGAGDAGAAGS